MGLNEGTKLGLLALARKSLETYLAGKRRLVKGRDYEPVFEEARGAFVTLHTGDGELRGCIGMIVGSRPVDETIVEMAVSAGTQDPRFRKVALDELKSLRFEISILTPPELIGGIEGIEAGRHGLIISRGWSKGLLLPQVATEWGFDRTAFLEHTCLKAGLDKNAWKDKETRIETFEAEVFGEEDEK